MNYRLPSLGSSLVFDMVNQHAQSGFSLLDSYLKKLANMLFRLPDAVFECAQLKVDANMSRDISQTQNN